MKTIRRWLTGTELYHVEGRPWEPWMRWWNATRIIVHATPGYESSLPRRFGRVGFVNPHRDVFVYALKPLHLPLRLWHWLGGRWMVHRALYHIGAMEVSENQGFSLRRLRWPLCTKLARDRAVWRTRLAARGDGQRLGYAEGHADGYAEGRDEALREALRAVTTADIHLDEVLAAVRPEEAP